MPPNENSDSAHLLFWAQSYFVHPDRIGSIAPEYLLYTLGGAKKHK